MSTIREFTPDDLTMLRDWWEKRGALPVPEEFLPRGFVVDVGPVSICCAFLYQQIGGPGRNLAMIEYLTMNPAVAMSRMVYQDVWRLISHIESVARADGATGIISLVGAGTGEEKLMERMGYMPPQGPDHRMFCKRLEPEVKA